MSLIKNSKSQSWQETKSVDLCCLKDASLEVCFIELSHIWCFNNLMSFLLVMIDKFVNLWFSIQAAPDPFWAFCICASIHAGCSLPSGFLSVLLFVLASWLVGCSGNYGNSIPRTLKRSDLAWLIVSKWSMSTKLVQDWTMAYFPVHWTLRIFFLLTLLTKS